jgi:hypothetical protein
MKNLFFSLSLFCFVSFSSHATVDSFVSLKIPVYGAQSSDLCMIESMAWDGISSPGSKEALAAKALNGPFKVYGIMAGEDQDGMVQVNALFEKGIEVTISTDDFGTNSATVSINATEAARKAKSVTERSEVVKLAKTALYAALVNTIGSFYKTVSAEVVGLPSQSGVKNPIPSRFNFSFSKESPYLLNLKKELAVIDGMKNCI